MSKPTIIEIESPERPLGKKAVNKLRDESLIPAVIYGPKMKENLHVTVPELELEKILASTTVNIANFKVEKKGTYNALLKKVEFHPVTDKPLHADFYALDEDTPVSITIPIRLKGTPSGVIDGGRLFQPLRRIYVKCDPSKIPAELSIDVSKLNIGDSLHVSDLDLEGVTPLEEAIRTIVVIRPPKGAVESTVGVDEDEEAEGEETAAEGADTASEAGEDSAEAGKD